MRLNMKSVANRVHAKTQSGPVAKVTSHHQVNPALAKVVVTMSSRPHDKMEAKASLAKIFDNKVSVVANSFRVLEESPYTGRIVLSGFIAPNVESMALTPEVASRMREMSSNVLMDETDNSFWQVNKSESGASFITRQFQEDLSELISIASVKDKAAPSVETTLAALGADVNIEKAEYVAFINSETASLDYGYHVAPNAIFSTESFSVVAGVNVDQIVQVVNMNGYDYSAELAATHGDMSDAQNISNYFEELCSNNPDFYVSLENDMEANALV